MIRTSSALGMVARIYHDGRYRREVDRSDHISGNLVSWLGKKADSRVNDVKFQGAFPPKYSNLAGDLFISMNLGSFS